MKEKSLKQWSIELGFNGEINEVFKMRLAEVKKNRKEHIKNSKFLYPSLPILIFGFFALDNFGLFEMMPYLNIFYIAVFLFVLLSCMSLTYRWTGIYVISKKRLYRYNKEHSK